MIKIKPEPKRPPVTENLRKAVTEKRGRPKKASALSNADRQRSFRRRKAAKKAAQRRNVENS